MKYSTQVKPISYLKSHTAEIVTTLTETREPMLITQNGEAKLVVMDVRSFEEQEQAMALLQLLAGGRKDIEEGRVIPATDVFAQIEAMDRDDSE
ncbi:type II toxin-antitoxin system Phd/YefM family antitoxin [Achromobacter mucicolens]|uniref:Antitoxin n=1 Tax=Achromobacter mucicolens TaxID=1389922 RepID=A0ABD4YTW7_9BURK|nr:MULTISPECIES: type II toxin-antitoxin system Phd/YefM family antitoxin [Achromobacter]OAE51816.1 prevent-host-death protein [Achromobacter xylosoxidans]MDH0092206.1 type II toxin-antitoxin system Phd/YefM family antitoxin [Achromobacter mucicolens]MDH1178344.1 type II toxin-antitoxin system Phd/YefM family antitoxin [Achromobacter mucicolens]MDH1524049.1 type II toxin-antitoxin system Phd/YefM family antitoxin [Achromobacter mucicolens]PTW95402.1 type II toxin-antitoxin system Phd/YefM fami